MPMKPGSSRDTISENIREMIAAGHSQEQAVAAALENARRTGRGKNKPAAPHRESKKEKKQP